MTKEHAAAMRIIELFEKHGITNNPSGLTFEEMCHDDLTAILTELMEPITNEDIEDQAYKAASRFSVLGDMQCVFESGYMAGAKWAATRNLKVSLEGLIVYQAIVPGIQHFPHAEIYLKSDVEKLVSK